MSTVLVVGNFDILHLGHIRLLKFAKECGLQLTVAVNSDSVMEYPAHRSEQQRLEVVASLECVDNAFITHNSACELIEQLKPSIVVKGKEFKSRFNPELEALNQYGGKLIFGSGEMDSYAEHYLKPITQIGRSFDFSELKLYANRHKIKSNNILSLFEKISKLRVAVIGEVIVDEYIQGSAVGLSQEDPTIVMTPNHTDIFLGGAAITAGHIKSMGADKVTLFSVLGADKHSDYVKTKIKDYELDSFLVEDSSRPTPLKTRYRVDKKTLLRVNRVRNHEIREELQTAIYERITTIVENIDILVFSDFNYGVLPPPLVDAISQLCKKHDVKIIADSQTSSQIGDISRYKGALLVTPTEKEVRVALNNSDDGLVILAKKLCDKSQPENLVITLAQDGVFIHIPDKSGESWQNDQIPAINKNAADPAGAGDCFLAASTLALTAGATPWQAFYLASIAAACQVDMVGNTPLSQNILISAVKKSFK